MTWCSSLTLWQALLINFWYYHLEFALQSGLATLSSFLCSLQAYVYDGKTAETLGELKDGEKAHKGGIYAVSC